MITDARMELPAVLETEVCIAGAGPAGIVLALELAARGRRVLLLEGGGMDAAGAGENLYEGEVVGRPYPLAGSRLRWLGGTSNHWGGWVRPLDAIDFEDKPHFPLPAWPFGADTLAPWYAKAADWCEVPSAEYDPIRSGLEGHPALLPLEAADGFVNRLFRFSPPTRFGERYRSALASAEDLDCRVHLNMVRLLPGDGRVRQAIARTLDGGECRISAQAFVLALGGVENARVLLNQAGRPGNHADLVGRCFMDHYGYRPGLLLADADLQYAQFQHEGHSLMPVLAPSPGLIRSERLHNACMVLSTAEPDPHLPAEYLEQSPFTASDARARKALHWIQMINEPLPHPNSRITLGTDEDALGLRRLRLHWHLDAPDFERVFALAEYWSRVAGMKHLGRFRWTRRTVTPPAQAPGVGMHHMGTTRMSALPEFGVVNPDGRVWDQENLYLAGSSVFPTAGFANPTLTLVALACRLAAHLGQDRPGGAHG
jgi:choline dehydrogenase-like flavoprotein